MPYTKNTCICSLLLSFIFTALSGCGGRAVGGRLGDGGPGPDGKADGSMIDAQGYDAGTCGEPLWAGFVLSTQQEPEHPDAETDDYVLMGMLTYMGPVTDPIAADARIDREVQIFHGADLTTSTIQYFLPLGLDLPIREGGQYIFIYRVHWGFEGYVVGLVINRPTSGLPPLLFIADTGTYGSAFFLEDPLISPLKVTTQQDLDCPIGQDPNGCGSLYTDQMVFDSSTGGIITKITLGQGEQGSLQVFGQDFTVLNMESTRIQPACPDSAGGRTAYLCIIQQIWPATMRRDLW